MATCDTRITSASISNGTLTYTAEVLCDSSGWNAYTYLSIFWSTSSTGKPSKSEIETFKYNDSTRGYTTFTESGYTKACRYTHSIALSNFAVSAPSSGTIYIIAQAASDADGTIISGDRTSKAVTIPAAVTANVDIKWTMFRIPYVAKPGTKWGTYLNVCVITDTKFTSTAVLPIQCNLYYSSTNHVANLTMSITSSSWIVHPNKSGYYYYTDVLYPEWSLTDLSSAQYATLNCIPFTSGTGSSFVGKLSSFSSTYTEDFVVLPSTVDAFLSSTVSPSLIAPSNGATFKVGSPWTASCKLITSDGKAAFIINYVEFSSRGTSSDGKESYLSTIERRSTNKNSYFRTKNQSINKTFSAKTSYDLSKPGTYANSLNISSIYPNYRFSSISSSNAVTWINPNSIYSDGNDYSAEFASIYSLTYTTGFSVVAVSAPTISRTTLASYTTATSVTFKGTYTIDSSLSVSSIKVYNSATGTTTTATVTTSSKSWSASITLGSVGTKNTLTATITDSNGQTATCSDYITRVNKPTISRTTLPSTTTSSSTTFSGTYTVDSNLSVSSIKVYNDNTGTTTTATVNTTNKTWSASISLGYGRNNLTATITDSNSSTATCTDYITRNTSVPSITCTNPSSNVSVSGITSYTLSGTATAATSTYPISTVKVNSTSATLTAGSGNTKNWSITVSLADGTNTFNIVATDTYGSSNSMTRTITRNRTAPTITFTAPTNGVKLAYNASPYHWAGTLTKDPLATWSSFKLTMWDNVSSGDLDNVNAANGTWAVYTYMAVGKNNVAKVEATDSFGQTATATLTYSRKYDAPKITWSSPTNTAFITKTQTPITGLVDWYYLNGYTPVGPEMRFHYKAQYRGGSSGANAPIDKATAISLSGGSDTIITEGGTDFHYWRQSWSFTPEYSNDFAYIQIAVNDFTADDSSSEDMYETRTFPTEARTILYSTKKPELTVTDPTSNITVYSPTYTVKGTCLPAFGDKYSFTSVMVNGALVPLAVSADFPTTPISWTREITLSVGDNNISVYAVDGAANMSPTLTRTITYKSIDLYCNVEVDFDGLITNEIKMREFTCKAGSPNKVKYLRCYENGTQIGETVSGGDYYEGVYTMGISPDVEGKNEYYIEMEDYAGNKVKSSKFYVTYTAKTATITITSPTEGQVFKSKVTAISDLAADTTKTVTGSVTCGNTYTTVTEIAGDGTPITVSNPSGTTNFTYQHTTKVGTNSTIVTATNSAGNIATLARNFVYVPYMAPTIELSGVLKYTNNSSVTIKDNEWWVVLNHARASLVGTSNLDAITNVKVTSSDGKTVQLQFSEDANAETGENTTTYKISAKTLELVDTSVAALETPREITLTLVATSKFGEVTSKQIGKIKYFAGKPVITFTNAEQNLITNQPSWNILGTVTKYEHTDPVIYIDGNGSAVLTAASGDRNWTFDKKVSLPSDGGYDFLFKVTDIYGNEAEANYFIQRFTQPPLITITDPKENLITNSLEIASHVIGETKPAANFVTLSLVTVNGTPYTLAVAPDDRGYFAIDTVANGIVEGVNEITVRVTDSVGNVATVTRHLRLDTHAPLIKDILADSISVDTNGIIHLTCKVTDPD